MYIYNHSHRGYIPTYGDLEPWLLLCCTRHRNTAPPNWQVGEKYINLATEDPKPVDDNLYW